MSTTQRTDLRDGLAQRHRKGCGRRACDCPWRANVYDHRIGFRTFKTFPTKTAAKLWRRDAQHAIAHGTMNAPSTETIAAALTDLIAGMRDGRVLDRSGKPYKPASIRSYERASRLALIPLLGDRKLSDLRRRDVQRYVDRLRASGLAPSTVLNRLDPLRVLCRRAVRDERLALDPCGDLDLPAVRHERRAVAGVDRAAELLDALPEGDRAFWSCAFYAGLRRGELRALRWSDVDFAAGVLRVARAWDDQEGEQDPKSYAGRRTVPMAGVLRRALAAHRLATGRGGTDLVFGRTASLPFTPSTVRARARAAWQAASLEPLSPHAARHTCASYLIAAGLNPKQVQTYIGHSDVRTTFNVYGHLLPGDEATAAAAMDALLATGTEGTTAAQLTSDPRGS